MSDLSDQPPVRPMDEGGDERIGLLLAGSLLVALGWGVLLALNLLLHRWAGSSGTPFGPVRIFQAIGPFAQGAAILGAVTGLLGAALVGYGLAAPKGRLVLPGDPY